MKIKPHKIRADKISYYIYNSLDMQQLYYDELCRDGSNVNPPQRFNTLESIDHRLGSIGQRKKVFIWFVPDNKQCTGMLETRILSFSRHLITYGFDVRVDLFINHVNEADWASWTDNEMLQADWIICVCSQSLCEMFHNATGPPEIQSLNSKATYLKKALYIRLLNDTAFKVIPVILQHEDDNIFFVPPILRDSKNILRIFDDTPFNVRKMDGDLERLICRMAGIDRMNLRGTESNHQPQGFIKLPSKIPQQS